MARKQKDTAQGSMLRQMRDDGRYLEAQLLGSISFEAEMLTSHVFRRDSSSAADSIASIQAMLDGLSAMHRTELLDARDKVDRVLNYLTERSSEVLRLGTVGAFGWIAYTRSIDAVLPVFNALQREVR